jgi:hypothetical protein
VEVDIDFLNSTSTFYLQASVVEVLSTLLSLVGFDDCTKRMALQRPF